MNDHSPTSNWATIVAGLHMRPGCDSVSILRLEAMVGGRLPSSYVRLLELSNGADGFIGDNSIVIYPAEDLIANPFPYGEFVPGYLFFAGDGGEAMFGFDLRAESDAVFVIHEDDLDSDKAIQISPNLESFFDLLRTQSWSERWLELARARRAQTHSPSGAD
jgi:hypothetical protein